MGLLQANTMTGVGLVADLGDQRSIRAALEVLIAELDQPDSWTQRQIAHGDPVTPAYGTVLEGHFVEHEPDDEGALRGGETRFFRSAVRHHALRPLVQRYIRRVIEINRRRRRPVWATDEDPAGTVAAAALAEADAVYIPDFVDLLESSSDGAKDVYQDHDVECVLWRWGWTAQTLPLAMDRVAVSSCFLETHAAPLRAYAATSEAACFAVCTYFAQRFAARYPEGSARHAYLVQHGGPHFVRLVQHLLRGPSEAEPVATHLAEQLGRALHVATLERLARPAQVLEVASQIFARLPRGPRVNPLEAAIRAGVRDDQLDGLVRRHPGALEEPNAAGQTPIYAAIQEAPRVGHIAHVLVLLSAGARLDAIDHQGLRPLDLAMLLHQESKHPVLKLVMKLLCERGARRSA